MSLYSIKMLHSYIWDELQIDQEVIDRIEMLAIGEKKTILDDNNHLCG